MDIFLLEEIKISTFEVNAIYLLVSLFYINMYQYNWVFANVWILNLMAAGMNYFHC